MTKPSPELSPVNPPDSTLTLVANPASPPKSDTLIYWDKREVGENALSLPELTEKYLLTVRREHMEWAWRLGVDKLAKSLACDETPSPWWTSIIYERHPKISPWLYDVYKLRALELTLKELNCRLLRLVGGDRRLRRALANFCAQAGIDFAASGACPKREPGWLSRAYWLLPARMRGVLRFIHWLGKIKLRLPFCGSRLPSPPNDAEAATIVTYFPNVDLRAAGLGSFRSRYWENLHDLLNEYAKREFPDGGHFVRWLFIRFPAPQLSFRQCLALRDKFRQKRRAGLSFHYLEEFLSFKDALAALIAWAKVGRASWRVEKYFRESCHFKNSRVNFWEYAREQWAESFRGWRALERHLQNKAFKRYQKIAGKQRWVLFPLENCPWERMLVMAFRANDTPVYGAQHSIIRPTDFRYFDDPASFNLPRKEDFQPDIVGGNGESACSQWLANGMPKDRLRQLEALRYLYINRESEKSRSGVLLPPEPGEPIEDSSRPILLVLTSFFADETKAHLELLAQALNAALFSKHTILIKPHPYLPVNDWLARNAARNCQHARLTESPLPLLLKKGVTVWASNSTTASLEAALKDLPLMVMTPCGDFDLCPIQNVPGLARTGSLADVKRALANLSPLVLPRDYLDLNGNLSAWRALLNL